MMSPRRSTTLDVVTSVFLLAASASVAVVAWILYFRTPPPPPPGPPTYRIGERLEKLGTYGLGAGEQPLLVLWLSSRCRYCSESMPFYRRLRLEDPKARVIVAGPEPADILEAYVRRNEFVPDMVLSVPASTTKFHGTPTTVLVDRAGIIQGVWRGLLQDEDRQREVLAAVR